MNNKRNNCGIGFSFSALLGVLVLSKVAHSLYKKGSENKENKRITNHSEELEIKTSFEIPKEPVLIRIQNEEKETNTQLVSKKPPKKESKAFGKNTWLNPTDDFGSMEKGKI